VLRVNVVTEGEGWILHRCARELADRLPGVTINARGHADLTYYMPAYCWTRPDARDPAVGLFTHPTPARLDAYTPRYLAHVAMNQRVAEQLRARGASPVVLRPGVSGVPQPITFGVCGRTYATGRKGEHLVAAMVAAGFDVVAWGHGWPCPILSDNVADLPAFYRRITYLVIPSLEEGGPMPVVDAIAAGVPVIAPDVGWAWEFPTIHYERGHWPSLAAVLEALTQPPTWAQWAEGHAALFADLEQGRSVHGLGRPHCQ
jgi:hypothetical protein